MVYIFQSLLTIIQASLEASDSTSVRLVGGHSSGTGLVELFVKGEWVTVHNLYFNDNEGKVVCRMLGYNDSVVKVYDNGNDLFGTVVGNSVLHNFDCHGDETDLNQCSSPNSWNPSSSYHSNDVGLSCEATQLRLVDGDTKQSGRVEFFFNGAWHSICDDSFDDTDARVICNNLGFSSTGVAKAFKGSHYGQGFGDTVISRLNCQGSETDIKYCSATWSLKSTCNHRNDAGVSCGGTNVRLVDGPTNTSGRVEIYHGGHWGTICGYRGFDSRNADVICRMLGIDNNKAIAYPYAFYGEGYQPIMVSNVKCDGSEPDISACTSDPWVVKGVPYSSCTHRYDVGVNCDGVTQIRLVDGVSEQSGRVEVLHNGHWGTIADTNFDNHDLAVICRMLGYDFTSKSFFMKGSYYGQGLGEIVVDNLQCNGGEDDIGHCDATWWPTTRINNHDHDIGVNCDGSTPIKLVGGAEGGSTGRVEYLHNGVYGTICSRSFSRSDLIVVCRMLGFDNIPSSAYWRKAATYSQGLGEIIVSDLRCNGIENNLGECSGTWPAYSSCTHQDDLYVNCQGDPEKLRLADGPNDHSGRVEIFHDGRWGTICDFNFDRADAVVICRVLNYDHPENAVFFTKSHFGSVNDTVPIVMTELSCNGLEATIGQCSPEWSKLYCSHRQDIGVDCCPSCNSAAIIG
ncbi:CD5 molecule-like [Mactra antiquata]